MRHRLWVAPVMVNGSRVWIGQISRDIGVRLTPKTLTTHKIDPAVDETRWYLIQDLFFSQGRIELRLSQETLARLIGATRQRVAPILKAWERDGIVKQQLGRIVLLERAQLEALARL